MRLQTELSKKQTEVTAYKQQLDSLKLTMETMSGEKEAAETQLASKSQQLGKCNMQVQSLTSELTVVRGDSEQLQEKLREVTSELVNVQKLLQEKDQVGWNSNVYASHM